MAISSSRFDTLTQLSERRRDGAARQLSSQRQRQETAAQQLVTLEQYRLAYCQQMQARLTQGLDPASWHNYQAFIASLDKAIAQCRARVAQEQTQTHHQHQRLVKEQQTHAAWQGLADRASLSAALQARTAEQRQSDEQATQAWLRRANG